MGTIYLVCACALILKSMTRDTAVGGQVLLPDELQNLPFLFYKGLLSKV